MHDNKCLPLSFVDYEKIIDEGTPEQMRQWAIIGLIFGTRFFAKLLEGIKNG